VLERMVAGPQAHRGVVRMGEPAAPAQ
jgi:hypothetical protein